LSRAKILVTSTFVTPFINEDLNILRKYYDLTHICASGPGAVALIARSVRHSDLVLSWFASTYAAVAVASAGIFQKSAVIAVGGADVAGIDEIAYGIWTSPWRARLVTYALRSADKVLVVDPFLRGEAMRRARYEGTNIECLPTGYDPLYWSPEGGKEDLVLSVAVCDSPARLEAKGVPLLLEAALTLPDVPFVLVGIHDRLIDGVRARAPGNVDVRSKLSREELRALYRKARVYCQASRIEGLPNAVCEAMLCGCVPVATDVGGMRSAVDGAGLLVPYGDPVRLAGAIMKAMAMPEASGANAREYIKENFTLSRRERGLLRVISDLT
jgi:glycosyltransferase involved in cell wall biosynthesis